MKTVAVSEEVKSVLQRCIVTPTSVKLPPGRLDRKLYEAVDKALRAAGGKWNKKAGGHVFAVDPRQVLAGALETGAVANRQQNLQAFFTPPELAKKTVELAEVKDGNLVLEPSAGTGALADAVMAVCPSAIVNCVELDAAHAKILADKGYGVVVSDFLELKCISARFPYDVVVMNPPFTKGQDCRHVMHAFKFLRPGGVLVGILSKSFRFRNTALHDEFRSLHAQYCDHEEDVPGGTFADTDVETVLVRWRKPL